MEVYDSLFRVLECIFDFLLVPAFTHNSLYFHFVKVLYQEYKDISVMS